MRQGDLTKANPQNLVDEVHNRKQMAFQIEKFIDWIKSGDVMKGRELQMDAL